MLPTITPDKIYLPAGTILTFPGNLADYEQLSKQLGDRSIPRVCFQNNHIFLIIQL